MTQRFAPAALLCGALAAGQAAATADDTPPGPTESPWQAYFVEQAREYAIAPTEDPAQTFTLRDEPILRWNQPVRGGDDGAVFLWLDRGRPAVIGTIFAWPHPDGDRVVQHELHSLAPSPLRADWNDRRPLWSPDRAGVEFRPVPDAPVPADSAPQRLRQLRGLAREFSAGSVDPDGREWELRLLPQPLYRYELDGRGDTIDGALFAIAQGTDPEVILLIEARRDGGRPRWEYACARFSDYELHVSHHGDEVWSVERGNPTDTSPHYYTQVERRRAPPPFSPGRDSEEAP